MAETSTLPARLITPQAHLMKMSMAYSVSRLLHVAAALNLADHLAEGPRTAEELAGPTGTHAPSLYRVMRALANHGLFTEDADHRFLLTSIGEALKTDFPSSARPTVLMLTGELFCRSMDNLLHAVRTGHSGFEEAFGMTFFEWLEDHPDDASLFSETMVGYHGGEHEAVAAAYDFAASEIIVDIGGATGNFLAKILDRHSGPRGILFDVPHVLRDAPALIRAHGLELRVTLQPGSFFDFVPGGGDTYLLSHIIHDWDEAQCIAILNNCRRAMKPASRLLIVEVVIPAGGSRHPGKGLDISMLVLTKGQERTGPEYADLLKKAGFQLTRIIPTESVVSIVEAIPA